MIPGIALMIAVYGSARLFNDAVGAHPELKTGPRTFLWLVWIAGSVALWYLAIAIFESGATTG